MVTGFPVRLLTGLRLPACLQRICDALTLSVMNRQEMNFFLRVVLVLTPSAFVYTLSRDPCPPGKTIVAELPPIVLIVPNSIRVLQYVQNGRSTYARVVSSVLEGALVVEWLDDPDICRYHSTQSKCVVDASLAYNMMVWALRSLL
jgi:hypothetical protein